MNNNDQLQQATTQLPLAIEPIVEKGSQITKSTIDELRHQYEEAKKSAADLASKAKNADEKLSLLEQHLSRAEKELSNKMQVGKGAGLKIAGYKISDLVSALVKPPEPNPTYEPQPDAQEKMEYEKVKAAQKKVREAKQITEDTTKLTDNILTKQQKNISLLTKLAES